MILRKNITGGIVGLVLVVVGSMVLVNNTSATSHTLTLSSSGAQNINITATSNTAISSDSISVATTCRYGYNLVSSTSVNDNNLYLNGDASNNASGTFFSPSDGTTILSNATNTWGYYYNANSAVAPTASSVFSPVPALGNTATIKTPLTTPASADISDSFDIYYGVSASAGLATGTYKMIPDTNNNNNDGTIIYYATMADACSQYTVNFSPTSVFEGNTLSGTGTMNDQAIYEGVATQLTANGFTAPSGYYFAGWNTQDDGSGTQYTNSQQVTDLVSVGSTITLYAMWTDCPGGYICYSDNDQYDYPATLPCIVGEMGNQPISNTATSATLYAPNYKCDGSGFVSWNTNPYGFGTDYGPNQTIEFTAGQYSNAGLKLYANWYGSEDEMQNWTGCSSMSIGDVTALTDNRDNNVYAIAKLADGKCWMIENLRLDNTASHNTDGTLAQGYNSSFIGLANPESTNFDTNGTANSLYSTDGSTAAPAITGSNTGYRFPRYNNNNTNSRQSSSSYSTDGNTYSMGNYYTWHAAIADTTYYSTNNQSIENTSLCPAGWRLPKGGNKSNETNNEFWNLIVTGLNNGVNPANYDSSTYPYYTGTPEGSDVSNALRSYPNNFLYSGYFHGSSASLRGSGGRYWSSTVFNNRDSYSLYLNSSDVGPGTVSSYKGYGFAIRCTLGS